MVSIRKFQEKDRATIIRLGENFDLTPYRVDENFQVLTDVKVPLLVEVQLLNPKIHIFVACIEGNVVGFISFLLENELSKFVLKKCASILFLSVDKQFRNQKIATKLLDFCLEFLKKESVSIVRIGTDYNNIPALTLYKKHDFNAILEWDIYRIYHQECTFVDDKNYYKKIHLNKNYFPTESVKQRPFAWFYEEQTDKKKVHRFLISKTSTSIQRQEIQWIYRQIEDNFLSLTIKRDKNREKYYGIKGSLWTISDLYETSNSGSLASFLMTSLKSLPKFVMAEYWVCGHDYKTKKILEQVGFTKKYSGISLTKYL